MQRIQYYYNNATSEAVGPNHGVTPADLEALSTCVRRLTGEMDIQRKKGAGGRCHYRNLPFDQKMLADIKKQVADYKPRCDTLIVLGIGGSALGNIALQAALNPYTYNLGPDTNRKFPRLFVLDNVDPESIHSIIELIRPNLSRTIINVVSKSGETAETASQFVLFRDLLKKELGAKYGDNILATTDPSGGTLRAICNKEKYRTLEVPHGVGGRFSVLSAVGLVSAAMCGIDIDNLMAGARDMDQRVSNPDLFANPGAMIGAIHYILSGRGKSMAVMMPYSTSLYYLADWFRQLWAESLGKKRDLSGKWDVFAGQTPIKALGTTDQHSQVQLYREGPNDKIITFLEVDKFRQNPTIPDALLQGEENLKYLANSNFQTLINAEKLGTEYALRESQRPTATVVFPEISAHTVGQFIYMYETAVSYMGELLGIDTYDQPAVQLGKDATYALMGKSGDSELRDSAGNKIPLSALKQSIQPVAQRDSRYML